MQHRKTLMLVLTALFAALTAIGAFFKIPFALAAISLQFLFTAMAGILLGAGYGALSQAVYVLIGLVGVPIFALGGGFSYVLQPTFGFLLGLIPSAFVIGKLAKRPLTFWGTALAMLAGLAVLYAIGVPYMALIANAYLGKGLTFWQVIKNGMLIYLPGDLLKIALGSFLCVAITRRLPQVFAAAGSPLFLYRITLFAACQLCASSVTWAVLAKSAQTGVSRFVHFSELRLDRHAANRYNVG